MITSASFPLLWYGGSPPGGGATLTADEGVFAWAGQPTNLLWGRLVSALSGSIVVSGADAGFQWLRRLMADTGMILVIGHVADLLYSGGAVFHGWYWRLRRRRR